MNREGLIDAFDNWLSAVKAARLDELDQVLLNEQIADGLRTLPDTSANKGGAPSSLAAAIAALETSDV